MNRRTRNILAVAVLALLLVGCKVIPIPESGDKALSTAIAFLDEAMAKKDWSLVAKARAYFEEAQKKTTAREAWYVTDAAKKDQWVNDARQTAQYRGAFLTMGIGGGIMCAVGVGLIISGIVSAYPKIGLGFIGFGATGLVLSIVAPELQSRAKIVGIGGAVCIVVLLVAGTLYLIWHLWKTVKTGAVVIDRAKKEVVPEALAAKPGDNILTVSDVAKVVMDGGVTKVFNAARRQLRAAGETSGDVIGSEGA